MIRNVVRNSVSLVPWRMRTSIKRLPVVAWLQRKMLATFLEGQEFVHTVDAGPAKGLVYPVLLPADKGVWTGTYELDFVSRLAEAVSPGDICLDVGGWRGFCAGVMACSGAAATYVFEPMPDNCERIQRLIELNPERKIFLQPYAVGQQNGTATFQLMPETSMGKLDDSPFQKTAGGQATIPVQVVSLDAWCESQGISTVGVIKFDVEGAELMALHGAQTVIESSRPRIFVEAHSRELTAGVTKFLTTRGYQVTTLETGSPPDGTTEPEVCHLQAISG